jgi:hypothetical protein
MGLDESDDRVDSPLRQSLALRQHGVGLSCPGSNADI